MKDWGGGMKDGGGGALGCGGCDTMWREEGEMERSMVGGRLGARGVLFMDGLNGLSPPPPRARAPSSPPTMCPPSIAPPLPPSYIHTILVPRAHTRVAPTNPINQLT
jgi:hypothetical protein